MKYAVLSLTLGYGKDKVLLKDIELWDENIITNIKDRPLIWSGRYVSYVSVQKLPLWIYDKEQPTPWHCYSNCSKTCNYFNIKLKSLNRSMIAEIHHNSMDSASQTRLALFYVKNNSIMCKLLSTKLKSKIDEHITTSSNANINNTMVTKTNSKFSVSKKPSHSLLNKKVHFNDTLSKLILTGLRLRDIPNTSSGFTKLYKMTFQAAEFAHREDIKKYGYQVPFELLQQTVETLLKLFTKT